MKKIAIVLAISLALLGGLWFTLTSVVINSDDLAQEMRVALEKATGRTVRFSKDVQVQLFPRPQVTFSGLHVSNIEGASTPELLTAERVVMPLDVPQLLAMKAIPSRVVLDEPEFHFEVIPAGKKNWQFAGSGQQSGEFRNYFLDTPMELHGGAVHYVNTVTGGRAEISEINGEIAYKEQGAVVEYNGTVALHDDEAKLMLRMQSTDLTDPQSQAAPFQLVLGQRGMNMKAQGELSTRDGEPEFVGTMEASAGELWSILSVFTGGKTLELQGGDASATVKGDVRFGIRSVRLTDAAVKSAGSGAIPAIDGKLAMEYRFGEKPAMQLQANVQTVDMDALMQSYQRWQDAQPQAADGAAILASYEQFIKQISGAMRVNVGSLFYRGSSINNIRLNAVLQPGVMSIREGAANMPGDARMLFSGNVSAREGLGFDGKFEVQGQKLESFMPVLMPTGAEILPVELGRFGIRTNVSLNKEQWRFSEFQARIAETLMAGSIILHRTERPKIESYLRVANLNLDVISKAVQVMLPETGGVEKTGDNSAAGGFGATYQNRRFDWLNGVAVDTDSDFLINDFVLFGRKGKRAEFNLRLGIGMAALNEVKAEYNGATITGAYGIRVEQGKNPYIQVDTTVSELDMVDLFPDIAHARNDDEWEVYLDEPLEMLLLQTYRADIKARVGKLRIRDYVFDKVNTEIALADSQLMIEKFTGYLWDGGLNMRGTVQAGTIPSLSLAYALENANLTKMSQASRLFRHAAGRLTTSGQVTTSGVKLRSWYNAAKGEIRGYGNDLSIQGFGISTLARAVPVARQVRDIERASELALRGGVTRISRLEGMVNIEHGKAFTPMTTFRSSESQGTVQGTVDLINETVDLTMQFSLLNTVEQGQATPKITLTLQGGLDKVKKELDTQELENYVSQRSAERALGRER